MAQPPAAVCTCIWSRPLTLTLRVRYDSASGMWLPPGKAAESSSAAAPPLNARRAWRKAAGDARGEWGVGSGLGASGLKYDVATGMWLPPPREALDGNND